MVRRTLVLVLALFAFTAAPASAGGPTSVILSAPPHVAAFGYNDPQYAELQRLTDGAAGKPGEHAAGRFVRATWLIHDMSVWRIDIIYPDAPGGPWILSANTFADTGPVTATWHRAADPVKLVRLLNGLKLLSGEFDGGPTLDNGDSLQQPTLPPETTQPPPAQPPPAETTQAEASATSSVLTGWRWILPGILLGAAGAVLALRLFPKRRWELID